LTPNSPSTGGIAAMDPSRMLSAVGVQGDGLRTLAPGLFWRGLIA
jgi:hypothetical protein